MTFRIRTVETTATGREIVRDRELRKQKVTIGRSSDNDIHLPDLAIDAHHATIIAAPNKQLLVKAVGSLGFTADGQSTHMASVDLVSGGELRFGSYVINVSREGDDVLLTVKQLIETTESGAGVDEKRSFTLAGVLPGRRSMSWLLAALVLMAFLALPIISNLTKGPDTHKNVMGDKSWSSGPLSQAHHGLEKRCEACHVKPFEAVRDETCKTCHQSVHDHAAPVRLAGARGGYPWGQAMLWKVGHAFGKPGPGACTDCHTEHEGAGRMEPTRQQFCADCHGTLDQRLSDTKLGNAGDFGKLHPQFKAVTVSRPGETNPARISLDMHPQENNGLWFPHKLHLNSIGGVAKMAASIGGERGYGSSLTCKDCHHPTDNGVRFKPIEMERDCEGCHSLVYDKVGPIFRKLRHGDVNQTIADLSAAGPRQPVNTPIIAGRTRPGDYAEGHVYHTNFAPVIASNPVARAFGRGGVCGECHTPALNRGMIAPVTLTQRYFQKGWFDHNDHKQEKCTACHSADKSSASSDVLMPVVAQCRTCHMGEADSKAEVPSSCAMCHSFHTTSMPSPKTGKKDS